MSEIGGMPILWHIMQVFSFYGVKDFIILAGYMSSHIKHFLKILILYQIVLNLT